MDEKTPTTGKTTKIIATGYIISCKGYVIDNRTGKTVGFFSRYPGRYIFLDADRKETGYGMSSNAHGSQHINGLICDHDGRPTEWLVSARPGGGDIIGPEARLPWDKPKQE